MITICLLYGCHSQTKKRHTPLPSRKKGKNCFWNFQKLNCLTLHLFQPRQRKQKIPWKIAYTWKNQVYLSMIALVCELWVVWSLWICWESGFACALCGPLSVCCCQFVGLLSFLASSHFLHVSVCKQNTYFNCRWMM